MFLKNSAWQREHVGLPVSILINQIELLWWVSWEHTVAASLYYNSARSIYSLVIKAKGAASDANGSNYVDYSVPSTFLKSLCVCGFMFVCSPGSIPSDFLGTEVRPQRRTRVGTFVALPVRQALL